MGDITVKVNIDSVIGVDDIKENCISKFAKVVNSTENLNVNFAVDSYEIDVDVEGNYIVPEGASIYPQTTPPEGGYCEDVSVFLLGTKIDITEYLEDLTIDKLTNNITDHASENY